MSVAPRRWDDGDGIELLAAVSKAWRELQYEEEAFDTAPAGTSSPDELAECAVAARNAIGELVARLQEAASVALRAQKRAVDQRGGRPPLRGVE